MRVLVTGADGFVGRHVVAHLTRNGHDVCEVYGPRSHRPYAIDLTKANGIHGAMQNYRPEAVLHLAAQSSVGRSWQEPANTIAINTVGTIHTWTAAGAAGVRRFVYVSSAEVYDPLVAMHGPLTEQAPIAPVNPYGASKAWAEFGLRQLSNGCPMELVILRSFNHIGPGQADGFVLRDFVNQIHAVKAGTSDAIHVGTLTAVRDFLDVRDVMEAYRVVLEAPNLQGTYNLCSGQPRTIQSVLTDLIRITATCCSLEEDAKLLRPVDTAVLVGNPDRLRRATGWLPRYEWEDTLANILTDSL